MGHSTILHADYCVGPRMSVAYILEYMSKFCEQFKNKRSFGFFWTTSLTHDYLTFAHNGDQLFSTTIHSLVSRDLLNTTVLIVFSDHGMRWGSIRETYQVRTSFLTLFFLHY
jgi:membrane-anchored protein YejM (alkaline phosphatase superfamily)